MKFILHFLGCVKAAPHKAGRGGDAHGFRERIHGFRQKKKNSWIQTKRIHGFRQKKFMDSDKKDSWIHRGTGSLCGHGENHLAAFGTVRQNWISWGDTEQSPSALEVLWGCPGLGWDRVHFLLNWL